MKNKFLTLLFLTLCSFCFSQEKVFCGTIDYTYSLNLVYLYQEQYRMVFNNEESFAEETNISTSDSKTQKESSDEGFTNTVILGRKNTTPAFFLNTKNGFYFSEIRGDHVLLVKEDDFNWNWELHNDVKQIGRFKCQKATTKFRGRNYTAWFTPEIPVSYGPWKFNGLSGLILEVYDEDYNLHLETSKITIEYLTDCSIPKKNLKLEKALSIPEYLVKVKEMKKAMFAQMSSKQPKGSAPLIMDENCEDCAKGLEIFND